MSQQGSSKYFADNGCDPLFGQCRNCSPEMFQELADDPSLDQQQPPVLDPCSKHRPPCPTTGLPPKLWPFINLSHVPAGKSASQGPEAGKQRVKQYTDELVSSSELGYALLFIRLLTELSRQHPEGCGARGEPGLGGQDLQLVPQPVE